MKNETDVLHYSTDEASVVFRWTDEPISFPDFDLHSGEGWINACDWPSHPKEFKA